MTATEPNPPAPITEKERGAHSTTDPNAGMRVLVVEDEALIAEEIRDRLTRLHFEVVGVADTGERAIEAAARLQPDLILMDIRLKGNMDGIEASEKIGQTLHIPVVFLTAHSDPSTIARAKGVAPFGYVLKPFRERDLLVAIEMATHRHRLEASLRESEQKYIATLASIGDGVIATDADGDVTFMNRVAEALTGWTFAAAEGLPVAEVFPIVLESTHAVRENPVLQALSRRETVEHTEPCLLMTRGLEAIPIDDSAAPIINERGKVLGAVVAFRDIRQRRLAADALQRAEEQVRQSQKMEAIGRLAGGVAHDFNNLLTVITGYSDLLLRSELAETPRAMIEEIHKASDRAAALTRQLLAFSRKQILAPVVFDLNILVADTEKLLRRLIGEDISLNALLAATKAFVRADPGQIEQVVMNLAVNSRDAMPQGGKLTLETSCVDIDEALTGPRPEMKPGRYVMLAVTDTGCGMDEATKANIFEPFFTTKEMGKGTGLGLATVYGTVKQSDGHVYVYSEPGHGTTFKIYLPAVENAISARMSANNRKPQRGNETILLAEDEDAVRSVMSSGLRMLGYTVLAASRGEEAIRICQQHSGPIHLLVTDVVMPEMSGRKLVERLTAMMPGLRVLYLSGYTDDAVVRHGILVGETPFLQKPFTTRDLALKVQELLSDAPSTLSAHPE